MTHVDTFLGLCYNDYTREVYMKVYIALLSIGGYSTRYCIKAANGKEAAQRAVEQVSRGLVYKVPVTCKMTTQLR